MYLLFVRKHKERRGKINQQMQRESPKTAKPGKPNKPGRPLPALRSRAWARPRRSGAELSRTHRETRPARGHPRPTARPGGAPIPPGRAAGADHGRSRAQGAGRAPGAVLRSEEAAPQPSRLPGRPRSSAAGGGGWGGGSAAGLRAGRAPWAGVWAPTTTPRAASTRTRTAPEVSAGPRGGRTGGLPPARRRDPRRAGAAGRGLPRGRGRAGGPRRSAPAFPAPRPAAGLPPGPQLSRSDVRACSEPSAPGGSPPFRREGAGAGGPTGACAPRGAPWSDPGWGLCCSPRPQRSCSARRRGSGLPGAPELCFLWVRLLVVHGKQFFR